MDKCPNIKQNLMNNHSEYNGHLIYKLIQWHPTADCEIPWERVSSCINCMVPIDW